MPHNPENLAPGTLLADRYLVGRTLRVDGEGPLYIGFDTQENEKIWIKEFMPGRLAARNHADGSVQPKPGRELAFKSLQADFEDLYRRVEKAARSGRMVSVKGVLRTGGTVYGITRLPGALTLGEYLTQKGGELDWSQAKPLILQLCTAVDHLHDQQVIHGGISPETVLVDGEDHLCLAGFSTMALRCEHGEIDPQLYSGYSSPEQYDDCGWITEASDVYGVGAVLYRMLSGTRPPESVTRRQADNLVDVREMDATVPVYVSAAIDRAMALDREKRTQKINQFTAGLLDDPESNTAVFDGGTTMAFQPVEEPKKEAQPPKSRSKKWVLLIAAAVCVGVMAATLPGLISSSGEQSSSRERLPVPEPNYVPGLIGMYSDTVTTNQDYLSKFNFSIREEFSEQYPTGVIMDQSPPQGVKMINKGTIILTVSKGTLEAKMPNLVGSTLEFAMQTLSNMKIQYQIIEVEDEYKPGIVGRTSIGSGETLNRETDTVEVYIGKVEGSSSTISSSSSSSGSGQGAGTRPAPPSEPDFVWGGFVERDQNSE